MSSIAEFTITSHYPAALKSGPAYQNWENTPGFPIKGSPEPQLAGAALRVLLVGCAPEVRGQLAGTLSATQWVLREAHGGAEALELLLEEKAELILVSSYLPDLRVNEFQLLVERQFPDVQIIMLGSEGPQKQAATQAQSGIGRELSELLHCGGGLIGGPRSTASESRAESSPVQQGWQGMVGGGPAMQRVYRAARLVAKKDTTVLIQGESGTGKDLLARGIHNESSRDKSSFVVINCAAIPEALLEAELFGYAKGAFTGATQARIGRVHAADGGTLFLDEIGEMPLPLQSKILRFLEQGEVQRIGGTETLRVDCRVIAATNADLKTLVKKNQFREDLYFRLAIFPMQLPPLRERKDDLDSLVESMLERFCPGVRLHPEARRALLEYEWPGNVRELRNVIERASLFVESRDEIVPDDLVF